MENYFRNVICWVCLYWILEYKKYQKEEQKKFYELMERHEKVRMIELMNGQDQCNTHTVIIPFDPV
jgi:hypothetical protein